MDLRFEYEPRSRGRIKLTAFHDGKIVHVDDALRVNNGGVRYAVASKIAGKIDAPVKPILDQLEAIAMNLANRPDGSAEHEGNGRPRRASKKQRGESDGNSGEVAETRGGDDTRFQIKVTPDEHLVNDSVLNALASDSDLFHRGGILVQVIEEAIEDQSGIERPADAPKIIALSPACLRAKLSRVAYFFRESEDGDQRQVHPPNWCASAIHQRQFWPNLRELRGIVTYPVIRADGSLLTIPGYDRSTRLLYAPAGEVADVPNAPTRDQALAARDELFGLVCDFPFEAEYHRSAWLAALLTPLARELYDPPAPLFLVDANTAGAGKGLSLQVIARIVNGRPLSVMSRPHNDDEIRKQITSLVIFGDSLVLIDNVVGQLGGPSLDAALTATVWRDRVLGVSRMVELPLSIIWYATGNNVVLTSDTARRTCPIRLHSRHECPDKRDDFKIPRLEHFVRMQRPHLLAKALTIVRAWAVAGRPQANLKPWGSFESWSDTVRNMIVWLDLPDPADGRDELRSRADRDLTALRTVVAHWHKIDRDDQGLTAGEIVRRLDESPKEHPEFRDALAELCGANNSKLPNTRAIGNALRRFRGRNVAGRAIDAIQDRSGVQRWRVVQVAGSAGSAGSVCPEEKIAPGIKQRFFSQAEPTQQTLQTQQSDRKRLRL
jgi:hypothetical protein